MHIRLVGVGPGREQFVDFGPAEPIVEADDDDEQDLWDEEDVVPGTIIL